MLRDLLLSLALAGLSVLAAPTSPAQCLVETTELPGLAQNRSFGRDMDANEQLVAATVREYGGRAGVVVRRRLGADHWSAPEFVSVPLGFSDKLSVSVSGPRMAIGAGNAGSGGAVFIYLDTPSGFVLERSFANPSGFTWGEFGSFVDLDGDRLAVGSPVQSDLEYRAGAVFLFRFSAGGWDFDERIDPRELQPSLFFGRSLALRGDLLAVAESCSVGSQGRPVSLYRASPSGWTIEYSTDVPLGSRYGWALDIGEDALFIGFPDASTPGVGTSGVVEMHLRIADEWRRIQQIQDPSGPSGRNFGASLHFDGERLAVGGCSWIGDLSAEPVHVFERPGSSTGFQPIGLIEPSSGAFGFGTAVALSGDDVWVSNTRAPFSGQFPTGSGVVARYSSVPSTEAFCFPYTANSTGTASELTAGFGCPTAAENDLVLRATALPPLQPAFLVVGDVDASSPVVLSAGIRRCLGGTVGRALIGSTSTTGNLFAPFDVTSIPGPAGPFAASAGQSYYAQVFHRDPGVATGFHATNGLRITVR